jgi:riboflavin transporter FmnP
MHAALVFAGGLVFAGSRSLSSTVRSIAPIVAGKALGLYGMFLLLTPVNVYRAYPAYEQAYAGVCLLMVMVMFDLTIMPLWLYNYFVRGSPSTEHRSLTA